MRILLFDSASYMYYDICDCLKKMGHNVSTVYYKFKDRFVDSYFEESFEDKISKRFDVVLSVNFYPLVAKSSNEHGIPYISWSYDSPLSEELLEYFDFDTNYIFLFDRAEVEKYRNMGHKNVYHLPLAANTTRLDNLKFSSDMKRKYSSDISFVGQLYEEPLLAAMMRSLDDYTKGYIDGLIASQINVCGADILTGTVTDDLIQRIVASYKQSGRVNLPNRTGVLFAIQKQITFAERVTLIDTFGEYFNTKFYNTNNYTFSSDVKFMGPVKYMTEMPAVFRFTKLNLCQAIRSITSGIPLRAIDIMASRGALFSNFQLELAENFEDGKDAIIYTSVEEAFDKANYYLKHEDVINKIAKSGYELVKREYTFTDRVQNMLNVLEV